MKRGYDTYHNSGVEWLADIPGHWGLTRLGMALSDSVAGGTPNTSADHYWAESDEDGMPWVAIGDMSDGGIVDCTEKSVTEAGLMDARLQPLPPGTIVYSMYASVGAVAVLGITAVTNQAILGLIPSNDVESPYLYWWLHALRSPVSALTRSNTQANLNADTVHRFPILVPPLEEQEQIGAYLDRETARIDKLITMQESLIERLDEYRAALITQVVSKGLPPEAAEAMGLDPAPALKDSGVAWLGEVPEHWAALHLRHICRFAYGDSLTLEDRVQGEIPVYGSNGRVGFHNEANTSAPVIVVGRKGSHGKVNFELGRAFAIDTTYFVDETCTASDLRWLCYVLMSADLADVSKDSAVPGLSREDAYAKYLPHPPIAEQKAIAEYLDAQSGRIDTLRSKAELSIERLHEYRSAVISAAVTGKIDVRDEALAGVGGGV